MSKQSGGRRKPTKKPRKEPPANQTQAFKFAPKTVFGKQIRKTPSLDKMNAVSQLTSPPTVKFEELPRGARKLTNILTIKTPAQQSLEECAEWYGKLAKDEPKFVSVIASMIGFRRSYAVAFRELQEIVDAVKAKGQEVPDVLVDFAIQYAMYQASKPFNEHDLMRGMIETILPWLTEMVDRHSATDSKEEMEDRAEANAKRKDRPVPINFKHTPTQEDTGLTRDRALVLVGWSHAIKWILDNVCNAVRDASDEQVYTIVRLTMEPANPKEQHARLINVNPSAWVHCTDSDRKLDYVVHQYVAPVIGAPIDLVVCDDMGVANNTGFRGRSAAARAGDAHRRFRRWCDNAGAAFIGAIPLAEMADPDLSGSEYEQLRTFSHLRLVRVQDAGEDYRIVIGTDATVFYVTKATLDNYGGIKSLIVPGENP